MTQQLTITPPSLNGAIDGWKLSYWGKISGTQIFFAILQIDGMFTGYRVFIGEGDVVLSEVEIKKNNGPSRMCGPLVIAAGNVVFSWPPHGYRGSPKFSWTDATHNIKFADMIFFG